ncbi:MFS transporter [Microbispora hainanensis]|uniref:MFS transporter n=1 Tax=Microbispora hainanensis TaxID=568844 RepID=UPI0033C02F01
MSVATKAGRTAAGFRPLPAWLLLLTVTVIGLNLRAGMGSIPPLLGRISDDLRLPATAQALLTSAQVIFIGLSAPAVRRLAARMGAESATAVLLGALSLSCLMRFQATSIAVLLVSAALAGLGMGGVSVLMPGLIAHHLPRLPGLATGLYSTAMAGGVALAAWTAGPLAERLGGWRPALGAWGVAAALTALAWLALLPRLSRTPAAEAAREKPRRSPWKSATARWITLYTVLQTIVGFSGLAWIAPSYVERGLPAQDGAALFSLFQLVQLVAMLTLPPITDHTRDRRPLLAVSLACVALGLAGMVAAPAALAIPAVGLFGLGIGGSFSLGLVLIIDAAADRDEATQLSAMVTLVGYIGGASGPLMLGLLHDLTGGFDAGYATLLVISLVILCIVPVFRPGRGLGSPLPARPAASPGRTAESSPGEG